MRAVKGRLAAPLVEMIKDPRWVGEGEIGHVEIGSPINTNGPAIFFFRCVAKLKRLQ